MIKTLPALAARAAVTPPDEFASLEPTLSARSPIVWGEPCSECAHPSSTSFEDAGVFLVVWTGDPVRVAEAA